MLLEYLIKDIEHIVAIKGKKDIDVTGVSIDSRQIEPGNMFIAIKGSQADGHRFIPQAVSSGATTVVCEDMPDETVGNVVYVQVESTEDSLGKIATAFYGYPSERLALIGVTGTNGKTTIATLLFNLFRRLGYKCGLVSTVANYIEDKKTEAKLTTPDAVSLNKLLKEMCDAGCQYAFMECSSIAIAEKRIAGLTFKGGIFTNLTRDHLDFHKTFDNYLKAKKMFFDGLPSDAFALTNIDDKNGMVMVQNTRAEIKTYSIRQMADFRAKILEMHFEGMELEVDGQEVNVQFVGKFNVSNLLAVYATARLLHQPSEEVLIALSALHRVSGRLDAVHSPDGITALVDYAHTPDALANVLNAIQEVQNGKGNIITVCGAGGNRDKGKRPLMAQEAVKWSDTVIFTSDNPRFEDPQTIINEMTNGLNSEQMKKVITIADRKQAIITACKIAQKQDVILVAGKGHETYQEIKGVRHHFNDKEILREIFAQQS